MGNITTKNLSKPCHMHISWDITYISLCIKLCSVYWDWLGFIIHQALHTQAYHCVTSNSLFCPHIQSIFVVNHLIFITVLYDLWAKYSRPASILALTQGLKIYNCCTRRKFCTNIVMHSFVQFIYIYICDYKTNTRAVGYPHPFIGAQRDLMRSNCPF